LLNPAGGGRKPPAPFFSTNMQIIKDALTAIAIVALAWIITVAVFSL
jgi:hypothetical protein